MKTNQNKQKTFLDYFLFYFRRQLELGVKNTPRHVCLKSSPWGALEDMSNNHECSRERKPCRVLAASHPGRHPVWFFGRLVDCLWSHDVLFGSSPFSWVCHMWHGNPGPSWELPPGFSQCSDDPVGEATGIIPYTGLGAHGYFLRDALLLPCEDSTYTNKKIQILT